LPCDHSLELLGWKAPIQGDSDSCRVYTNKVSLSLLLLLQKICSHVFLSSLSLPPNVATLLSSRCMRKAIFCVFHFSPNGFCRAICSLSSVCLMWMCVVHNELACNDGCARGTDCELARSLAARQPASHPHNVSSRTLRALHFRLEQWHSRVTKHHSRTQDSRVRRQTDQCNAQHESQSIYVPQENVSLRCETVNHNAKKRKTVNECFGFLLSCVLCVVIYFLLRRIWSLCKVLSVFIFADCWYIFAFCCKIA